MNPRSRTQTRLLGKTNNKIKQQRSLTAFMDSEVCTPYTLHPTPYTLHPTPYTLHPTPYTPPYTLHPTPYSLITSHYT